MPLGDTTSAYPRLAARHFTKRSYSMKRYAAMLLAGLVAACGGGGDGGGPSPTPPPPFSTPIPTGSTERFEESDSKVTLSGAWAATDGRWGWSNGAAVSSSEPGAKASLTFTGTAVRWIGARGQNMGKAKVSIDGVPVKDVDLFILPTDEVRTNVLTIYGLSSGSHTLTIEVVSGTVVVDAFETNPKTSVSHWQETDPSATYSAGWTQADSSVAWSGSGVSTPPDAPLTAQQTSTADETVTVPFRGTSISWIGSKGPDGGIATVQIDGGTPVEVDTYSPTLKVQEALFTSGALSDGNHTLTVKATGTKNAASGGTRITVDAFDVMTPAIRAEEDNAFISYNGFWDRNVARVFSEGVALRAQNAGASVTFTFTGTSVSWIGARKSSGGGTANVYLDGAFVRTVTLRETYPTEAYQATIFRVDGLASGRHELKIVAAGDGHVYVDAFDVHP
jgi:hypothetical protein